MSEKYEATGTVYVIPPARSDKYGSIVVQTEAGQYPQFVPFDCKKELASSVSVGDQVKVTFNLRGREWRNPTTGEVKYFGQHSAFKIDVIKRGDASAHNDPPTFGDDEPLPF